MIKIADRSKCSGCHACAGACPQNCIEMKADGEGFLYPGVDLSRCVNCALCEAACPILQPPVLPRLNAPEAYGVYNKDEKVRLKSSSGGVFTLLANYVIQRGGVVFGAAFDEFYQVRHRMVTGREGLAALRGSKYVQSIIGDAYRQAEKCLRENKPVLFTGTPCQVEGLYSYLKKDYDQLITHDLICHGVIAPAVWEAYLQARRETHGSDEIRGISFKDKSTGWRDYSLAIEFGDGGLYKKRAVLEPLMKAFIGDYCLRPSCYACAFKKETRISDFTLADLWGADKLIPELDDDKGLSMVTVNSEKGRAIFSELKRDLIWRPVALKDAVVYNPSMIRSAPQPKEREAFIKRVEEKGFDAAARQFLRNPLLLRLKRTVKRVLRK